MRQLRSVAVTAVFCIFCAAVSLSAANTADFKNIDRETFKLLESKEWDNLIETAKNAVDSGIDYYYLRIRLGIAYYNKAEYKRAAIQFEKALSFNPWDQVAMEYAYYSYILSGDEAKANRIKACFPEPMRERLKIHAPRFFDSINTEFGSVTSDNESLNSKIDIDGAANIYGEFTRFDEANYYHAAFKHWLGNYVSIYHGYSALSINMTKQIRYANADIPEDKYTTTQTQYYFGPSVQAGKNIKITTAMHLLNVSYNALTAAYNTSTGAYDKERKNTKLNDYVAVLALSKDIGCATWNIFGTYSELNKGKQTETGLALTWFPKGTLNLYTNTTITFFSEKDADSKTIFDQMVGIHLSGPAWIEGYATSGKLKNFNEKNGFIVYNIGDEIKNRYGIALLFYFTNGLNLSLRYQYAAKEASYVTFTSATASETHAVDYQAQTIIGGLQWKF